MKSKKVIFNIIHLTINGFYFCLFCFCFYISQIPVFTNVIWGHKTQLLCYIYYINVLFQDLALDFCIQFSNHIYNNHFHLTKYLIDFQVPANLFTVWYNFLH